MKITKTEWIWLIITAVLYIAYNLPGVPKYEMPVATIVHACVTVLPLWVISYIFLPKVFKMYKIKDKEDK